MKHPIHKLGGALLLLFAAFQAVWAEQETPRLILFKIESAEGAPSYLFGTLHLPRPEVVERLDYLGPAFDDAGTVLTEIDMNPTNLAAMSQAMLLPEGETLQDHLPDAMEERLQTELQSISPILNLQHFNRLTPWALQMTLSFIEDQIDYPNRLPLDLVLHNRARDAGKEVGGLETVEEQIDLFADLSDEEQLTLLDSTLDQLARYREEDKSLLDEMTEIYLAGDAEKIGALLESTMPDEHTELSEKMVERLITRRNEIMAERIATKIQKKPDHPFLFAVGAGHLFGEDGIPALLEKAGFTVTDVEPEPATAQ